MSDIFPNYIINLDDGTVFHTKRNGELFKHGKTVNKDGYYPCEIYDIYGNKYNKIHQVILAEGLQLPKHMWPCEENGRRYIPDHIIPVSNGGTDTFSNLRLIPLPNNNKNDITRKNHSIANTGRVVTEETKLKMSKAAKGKVLSEECRKHLSEAHKKAWSDGKYKMSQGFIDAARKIREEKSIPVDMIDESTGEIINSYKSASNAATETGYNKERILFHCKDGKPYKGVLWRRHLI